MKLEVVVLPVSDVDRAKDFYEGLGWRLDPRFGLFDHFGVGVTSAPPGSAVVYLIVDDLDESRKELADGGADVGEVFHREDGEEVSGPDPEGRSYFSLASFNDPDGNRWLSFRRSPSACRAGCSNPREE